MILTQAARRLRSSDLVRKVGETFGTRVVVLAIGLVNTVVVARALGPEGRGEYAVVIAIGAIGTQLANLGIHSANTYFVARDRSLLPGLLSNALCLGAAALAFSVLLLIAFLFAPDLAPLPNDLMPLALVLIPAGLIFLLLHNLLLGIHDVRAYNKIELLSQLAATALLVLLLVLNGATVTSTVCAAIAGITISATWAYRRLVQHVPALPRPSKDLLRRCVTYGAPVYIAVLFGYLVLKSDLLLVQYIEGPEASGQYSIASSLADALWLLPAIVGTILFPRLVALEDPRDRWMLARRATLGLMLVLIPMLALAAALAGPAIEIVFGDDYAPATSPFRILCAAIFFYGTTTVFSQFLAARGLPWRVAVVWVAGFALNFALNLFLIPALGIDGAALSSLASYALVMVVLGAYAWRKAGREMSALN